MVRSTKKQKRFREPTNEDMFLNAVASGRVEDVESYLNSGGDPHVTNCKGQTAIHLAASHHRYPILEMLLRYYDEDQLDARDMYGLTPFITAIKHQNSKATKIIADYWESVRTKPYKFKPYSFNTSDNKNRSVKSVPKYKSFNEIVNSIRPSNKNPIIYPSNNNVENSIVNSISNNNNANFLKNNDLFFGYLPKKQANSSMKYSNNNNNYNNTRNTKRITIRNKKAKKATKKASKKNENND
jgi:hypothetical protein